MKIFMLIVFIINIAFAVGNYIADDLLRAIWYLGLAIIILICNFTSEVAEND